jgi:hypothetical protein
MTISPLSFVSIILSVSEIDPSLCYTTADFVVADNWTDYLIDKKPTGDLRPGLASSWKVAPDDRGERYRCGYLRTNLSTKGGSNQ